MQLHVHEQETREHIGYTTTHFPSGNLKESVTDEGITAKFNDNDSEFPYEKSYKYANKLAWVTNYDEDSGDIHNHQAYDPITAEILSDTSLNTGRITEYYKLDEVTSEMQNSPHVQDNLQKSIQHLDKNNTVHVQPFIKKQDHPRFGTLLAHEDHLKASCEGFDVSKTIIFDNSVKHRRLDLSAEYDIIDFDTSSDDIKDLFDKVDGLSPAKKEGLSYKISDISKSLVQAIKQTTKVSSEIFIDTKTSLVETLNTHFKNDIDEIDNDNSSKNKS
jgi:hypothetical protein